MASAGVGRFWWCAVAGALLLACGGSTSIGDPGATAGTGGGAAGGASGGAGAAGTAGNGSCFYEGKTYADGARFPASDGCNTCSCNAGVVGCTLLGCSTGCQYNGQSYQPGQSFKIDCNSCSCGTDGRISCTEIACPDQCSTFQEQYAAAVNQAKACERADQCTTTVSSSFPCGCATPVNASNQAALAALEKLAAQAPQNCLNAACAPCIAPGPATCTPEGRCELAPTRSLSACKVDGVVYPSGSSGILKPGDCNTCTCMDGELTSCTKKACTPGSACPSGTLASTQCAQCGPTDACEIVEHACLPTCTDACATGFCAAGVCRTLCG